MALNDLRQTIKGRVLLRGDDCFEQASKPWNLAIEQPVAAVVEVYDAEDVATLVTYARQNGMTVSGQRTGHTASGNVEGIILFRTGRLNAVEVNPRTRQARVGAGVILGEVQAAAAPLGLTGLPGTSPAVSVVGSTLGGGFGWFARKHGFASGSVRAFDIVDADGLPARVTEDTDPDLFWALRGGGGDFAVVTSMEFELFPAPELYGGRVLWPVDRAPAVLDAFREITATAPEELTLWFDLFQFPGAPPMVAVDAAYLGEAGEGRELLSPLDKIDDSIADSRGELPLANLLGISAEPTDPTKGAGQAELLSRLDDKVAETLLAKPIDPLVSVQLRQLGGAMAEESPGGSAAGRLVDPFLLCVTGSPTTPEVTKGLMARKAELIQELGPYVSGRKPYNFLAPGESAAQAFPELTLRRLRDLKRARDPHNVFRANFPILA
ncbi:FAD-binding oxidoreductase [Acrocarpospora catenulata]|uniref:FAD-binding oxidoreductase n=1 Tax=Acrocarpospora catenulata TaxID=2836182 RepID=UPI001BDAA697|nr:FAD-binding oxidoreductase [Acrocarpospora catenulata]